MGVENRLGWLELGRDVRGARIAMSAVLEIHLVHLDDPDDAFGQRLS